MPRYTTGPWLELTTIMQKDRHWTYRALAERSGLSHQYIRLLEQGKRPPTPRAIRALSDALKVPYSVLEPNPDRDGDDTEVDESVNTQAGAA